MAVKARCWWVSSEYDLAPVWRRYMFLYLACTFSQRKILEKPIKSTLHEFNPANCRGLPAIVVHDCPHQSIRRAKLRQPDRVVVG